LEETLLRETDHSGRPPQDRSRGQRPGTAEFDAADGISEIRTGGGIIDSAGLAIGVVRG
jgi:hypothetical protein